jgi:GH15 family glucan-1,4-alpha-glucosidase
MQSASSCLYNEIAGYFYKGVLVGNDDTKHFDETMDISSLYGAFMFGLFDSEGEQVKRAITTARGTFPKGELYTRFVGDDYYGKPEASNRWPIVSLWMAEIALERDEMEKAEAIIRAVVSLRGDGVMIPEQVSPTATTPTSLAPLVWSHAELISALIDYSQTRKADI